MANKPIGKVTHFFDKIKVAVVELSNSVKVGDNIQLGDGPEAFEQNIKSMQVEHEKIDSAKKGQEIGLKVSHPVKKGWKVYKV